MDSYEKLILSDKLDVYVADKSKSSNVDGESESKKRCVADCDLLHENMMGEVHKTEPIVMENFSEGVDYKENNNERNGYTTSTPGPKILIDDILSKLGRPGLYHIICYSLLWMFNGFIAFNHISLPATMGITPAHNCSVSTKYLKLLSLPNTTSTDQLDFEQCHVIWRNNGTSRQVDCDEWVFGEIHGYQIDSIVTKWSLVCKKKFYPMLSNTVYFVGVMVGGGTIGHVSDKYGRRPVVLLFSLFSIIITSATVAVPDFITFTALRFVAGIVICGLHSTIYVMTPEITPRKLNNYLGLTLILSFLSSISVGGIVCWLTKSFWKSQLILTLPLTIPLVVAYFFLPESFRWMVIHRRYKQVSYYLKKAARINRVSLPHTTFFRSGDTVKGFTRKEKKKMNACKVFTYKEIRRRLLSIFVAWASVAISFYTLSLNMRTLSSDPYLAVVFSASVDLIPVILSYFVLDRFGKRRVVLLYLLIGGCFCVIYKFVDHIAIVMIGKMFASISFGLVYILCVDLFPTVVRNLCVGMCVTIGRFGSVVAPQFVLLGVHTAKDIPVLLSGIFMLMSAVLVYFLPEMSKLPLPDTIEDVENYKEKLKGMKNNNSVVLNNVNSK